MYYIQYTLFANGEDTVSYFDFVNIIGRMIDSRLKPSTTEAVG